MGRAKDISPKARIRSLMGYACMHYDVDDDDTSPPTRYTLPFDRHDWIVERDGRDVRYVVDFYPGQPVDGKIVGIHIDARPAVDSVDSAMLRLQMSWKKIVERFQAPPHAPQPPSK